MNNHPPPQQLEQYFARTLAPDLFLLVHKHVSSCRLCSEKHPQRRTIKEDYETLWSALTTATEGEPDHLSDATLSVYLDNGLSEIDQEIADSHLEFCEACRDKVWRLRESTEAVPFKKSVAPLQDRSSGDAGFWQRVSRALALAARRPALSIAALLILCFVITAALILLRSQTVPRERPSGNQNSSPQVSQASGSSEEQPFKVNREPQSETQSLNVVVINDGPRRVTVDGGGRVMGLEELPSQLRQAVRAALISQSLERPTLLSELRGRASTLRGATGASLPFKLLSPFGQIVQSDQPEFRWQPLTGAESYVVTITDSQLNEIAVSGALNTTRWRTPKPLARGVTYSWQVTARKGGQNVTSPLMPAPEARFRVLDKASNQELLRARRAYRGSHLTLGVLYFRYGLLDEAEQEFRALVKENPQSNLARKLLHDVELMKRE
ncbi:MAG: zf-HC2 domain-containing protein [Pyrinomonadaceae bacterium]|nr:zf-HC2 domain-containing protein [Pyrinomonadaceae bacterium]